MHAVSYTCRSDSGNLAAQVTLGGGFGLLAAGGSPLIAGISSNNRSYSTVWEGYDTPDKFLSELSVARSALRVESHSRLPIGVGYLGWQLEKPHSPALELLSLALENNVQAVWFAFGNNLGQWVRHVRDHDQKAGRDQGTIIFAQVSSVEEALTAANDWKVDVLVAQGCKGLLDTSIFTYRVLGIEAGGHGANYAPPVLTLVSSILSALPEDGPPVLAAGGLANGGHVASLITLGASGVVFGTRFLLSPESLYSDVQRKALLAASSTSSVRTMAFDHARGTLGWPHGIDGRGLRNRQ